MTKETGLLSAEELNNLEATHGKLLHFWLQVSEGENAHFYLRQYKRQHAEAAMKTTSAEGAMAGGRYLLDNLFVAGDERVRSDEDEHVTIRISASWVISQSVELLPGGLIKNS